MKLPLAILRDGNLSDRAKLLYGALVSYAWDDPDCYPSQAKLAADLGWGGDDPKVKRTDKVQTAAKELEAAGLITRTKRRGTSNVYTLTGRDSAASGTRQTTGGVTAKRRYPVTAKRRVEVDAVDVDTEKKRFAREPQSESPSELSSLDANTASSRGRRKGPPPTETQLGYLRDLSRKRNVAFSMPETRAAATAEITRLEALPVPEPYDPRVDPPRPHVYVSSDPEHVLVQ